MDKIAFFGLGYVGLTTAAAMASRGFKVIGYDVDKEKVASLKAGRLTIYEPGLSETFKEALKNIKFTSEANEAVNEADIIFITVGTPSKPDGSIDLSNVISASRQIGESLNGYKLVVVKSTVLPGSTMGVVRREIEDASNKKCCRDFGLAVNPEFLREGSALEDTLKPDRIIIGEADKASGDQLEELWRGFLNGYEVPIVRTTPENAELIKYANNAFLAMKVTFANMFARMCMKIPGTDIDTVMKGIGLDKRIGPYFLNAGMSWGGSCFPKDLKAIVKFAQEKGVRLGLLEETLRINSKGPEDVALIAESLIGSLKAKAVCVLGVTFKPDTDDVRESPSFYLVDELKAKGAKVKCYDPKASAFPTGCKINKSPKECINGSDLVILVTEWDEFKYLKPEDFLSMKSPVVIDTRRILNRRAFEEKGIKLVQLGVGV